jgi:shikimate kinase
MQLQFLGLPGSGKTTIVDALIHKYPDRFIRGEKRYNSISKLLISNPKLFLKSVWLSKSVLWILILSVRHSKIKSKDKIIAIFGLWLNISNYKNSINKTHKSDRIIIWDELTLQRTLSIFAYSGQLANENHIVKFIKWSVKHCNAFPVVVNLNIETQNKRLFERGVPKRMQAMTSSTISEVINSQNECLKLIVYELKHSLILDARQKVEDNVQQIISFLEKLLN